MTNFRALASAVSVMLLLSCASPQTIRPELSEKTIADEEHAQSLYVLERRSAQYARVYNIADRLSRANVEFCPRTRPTIGVRFENLNDVARDLRPAAQDLWGLSNAVSVSWVGENSPAARAGVRVRDQVLAINGEEITPNRNASRRAFSDLRDAAEAGDVRLQVARGEEVMEITVTPEQDCAYQFVMVDDPTINAAADGRTIYFNRGMLQFAENDEEIALIIGHELAHNAMGHIESAQQNAMMGSIGGALLDIAAAAAGVNTGGAFADAGGDIGARMFSQEFESEADYVGMYFMARGGYSIDGVEGFWRRMSAENPRGIRLAYTHPSHASRFLGLAATRQEITALAATNAPLRPRMRGDATEAPATATDESRPVSAETLNDEAIQTSVEPSALGPAEPSPQLPDETGLSSSP